MVCGAELHLAVHIAFAFDLLNDDGVVEREIGHELVEEFRLAFGERTHRHPGEIREMLDERDLDGHAIPHERAFAHALR